MNRRDFLKILISIPVLGGLLLFVSPLFRYLRPTTGPLTDIRFDLKKDPTQWKGEKGIVGPPDLPEKERDITFSVSDFKKQWDFQTFTFAQRSKEYTFRHFQATSIPAYAVRLNKDGEAPDFIVVSRICPHMGCVFNFLPDPADAAAYNYPGAKNPLFACPCHLSVYDPLQRQDIGAKDFTGQDPRGKVVSGPAPRPPRGFTWKLDGDKLVIISAELGGIS